MKNTKDKDLEIEEKRKHNMKIYKIYKMLAWDFLFYYATNFLFLMNQKGLSLSLILVYQAAYVFFRLVVQVPCQLLIQKMGKRFSLVLGNLILVVELLITIFTENFGVLIFSNFLCAIGFNLKDMCESDILYDAIPKEGLPKKKKETKKEIAKEEKIVGEQQGREAMMSSTRNIADIDEGKRGSDFAKIEGKTNSLFYVIDAITAATTGFLYVINPFIPMLLSFAVTVVCLLLSLQFEDLHKHDKSKSLKTQFKDLKQSLKTINKSMRLKSLFMVDALFMSMYDCFLILRNVILIVIGVKTQYFGVAIACFTLLAAISTKNSERIHKKHTNRTLTYLCIPYATAFLIMSMIIALTVLPENLMTPVILFLMTIPFMVQGPYFVLIRKYYNNFTDHNKRVRIQGTKLIAQKSTSTIFLLIAAGIAALTEDIYTPLFISGIFFILMVIIIDVIRGSLGKKPKEYSEDDII